jgi:small subunit ribosomal protein S9
LSKKTIQVSGKRKTAVARATLKEGTGKVKINSVPIDLVTPKVYRMKMQEPLVLAEDIISKIDLNVSVAGGGANSQAEAVRTAIAKALAEHSGKLKPIFMEYDRNLLVADVRLKETHKPNRHGHARAMKQKSYR